MPKQSIDDNRYILIDSLGVQTLAFVVGTNNDNYQIPETSQRAINKLIDVNTTENLFKIDWENNTAWHGKFSAVAIEATPNTRGDTYSFEGTFDVKQIDGIKIIATPTISQIYENFPMDVKIIDLSTTTLFPTEQKFAFSFTNSSLTDKLLITFYNFVIRLRVNIITP